MALLGTFWNVNRLSTFAGNAAPLTTTFPHSVAVPGSAGLAPQLVLPQLRSMERQSNATQLFAEGANGSLATVGVQMPTIGSGSSPVTAFDLYVVFVHSLIQ